VVTAQPVETERPGLRLRAWQAEALAKYRETTPADFLVTATPGAGKTSFALALANELMAKRVIDRVIVVAPTDHLRTQWAYAADRLGLRLDPTLGNDVGPVRGDLHGYVTTYAQVAAKPALHEARTRAKRSLVVLDEIHHAGDGLSWGEATRDAFDTASRRLALTGTPFRTRPDERIPFVRYETDSDNALISVADYTYGYGEALAEGVVRPVVFAAYTGVSRWKNSAGDVIAASLSETSTKSTEARAWKTALNPAGKWIPHVIAAMDERITHLRARTMPDAAGLVLASDQNDAREYAEIVKRITGHKPALILSDDPKASKRLERFTHSDERFAVCVRMISEGVDIPRAACLAWMTSYRTPLFFAQAVGRVVRSRRPGEAATVFLPAVRPLLALAAEIEQARNHVMPPRTDAGDAHDLDPLIAAEDRLTEVDSWEALDSDAEFAHVLEGGRAVVATHVAHSEDDQDYLGLPGLLTAEQTASLLARRDEAHRRRATGDDLLGHRRDTAWQSVSGLKKEIHEMVGQLAARKKMTHAAVHAQLRKAVPSHDKSPTEEVLIARRDWLMEQLF
ncbi:MAG TPA: DEAD/DEAH box helicase family protein, partial [Mycobacteriales bacterium]|nr:DEAD/DEAH box helicase family protein [Mycobacteriales bacterium]